MSQAIVSDSTILIGLERIEHLYVLPTVFEPILIPPAVDQEFGIDLPWLRVEVPTNQGLISALKLSVDEGEAEAVEKIKKAEAEVAEAAPSTFGDLLKAAAEGGTTTEE